MDLNVGPLVCPGDVENNLYLKGRLSVQAVNEKILAFLL